MSSDGEPHAWVLEAVDQFELPLMRYARRLLGDVDLAADAVQHAFVKLCGQSRTRVGDHVAAWLFRVCRNHAVDQLRRGNREQTIGDGQAESSRVPAPAIDARPGPAATAEARDLATVLRQLLHDLPPSQRETIDLWCEGFSYAEIAEITDRSPGNVRVLAHRGLAALRSHPLVRSLLPAASLPTAPGT